MKLGPTAVPERFASGPYLMGIVNCTPDSFSDGGEHSELADAIAAVRGRFAEADLLDLGGEASGPNARPVAAEEELRRVLPLVRALAASHYLSIDTFRASTAAACLAAGARMINDISALRFDADMASVVREYEAHVVLMFSKESGNAPHASRLAVNYADVVAHVGDFLEQRIEYALASGISEQRVVLDPGMGAFVSVDAEESWTLLESLDRLKSRFPGVPFLVGTSRKGFLGGSLQERDPISQLTALIAHLKGAAILRTHQPSMARQFLDAWKRTMN